jgi:predicted SprT family Zn-dependent metalloprotease
VASRALQSGGLDETAILSSLENEARAWAVRLHLPLLASRVHLRWHVRLRTTAGLAHPRNSSVLLNPRLLSFPEELTRTFLHELAHLIAHARFPRRRIRPHGIEWRQACRDLGLADERRCHTLPLAAPRRVAKNHLYHCPRCLREVARARPFRRAEACLSCCRTHAGGRYDRLFRFVPGRAPARDNDSLQPELFRLWGS